MNRRNFIKHASCGAMGSATLLSSLTSLGALNGLVNTTDPNATGEDYKALVCILFAGGMDSYNMLVPRGTTVGGDNGFNEYKTLRTDLAFYAATDLLPLNNTLCSPFRNTPCEYQSYGIHPGMVGMQSLFNTGKMAMIANIGTLVEPLASKAEYNSGLKKLPLGIYSHSDQIMQWQTSVPQSRDALGVGGRIADLLNANNTNSEISMNISLSGKNVFQRGSDIAEYTISDNVDPNSIGITSYPSWYSNSGFMNELRSSTVDSLVSSVYSNLLQKTYNITGKKSLASFEVFKNALKRIPATSTIFAGDSLSKSLQAISKVISVRQQLGAKRQIFFVTYGGWDMHDNLVSGLAGRLPIVSAAMKSFYDSTVELGISDKITTFTISDFARTLTSNGQGSDHAWGGNNMIMGGAVNGSKIYGAFPKMNTLSSNLKNVSDRGNFIPTVSTDEMYAELALWYGVSPSDLCYILPNIGNFYSSSSATTTKPIGFMDFSNTPLSTINHPKDCLIYN